MHLLSLYLSAGINIRTMETLLHLIFCS